MSKLFEGLNEQQLEAVKQIDGTVQVVAAAGSGKSTLLTRRIAYLIENGVNPSNILCTTFTKKAAKDMKVKLETLIPQKALDQIHISTLHSLGYGILRRELYLLQDDRYTWFNNPLLMNSQLKIFVNELKREIEKNDMIPKDIRETIKNTHSPILISHVSMCKNFMQTPKDNMAELKGTDNEYLAWFYQEYENKKIREKYFDVSDLIFVLYQIFKQHPHVLQKYQDRFKYISVDEVQDTGTIQHEIVKMLAHPEYNLLVVGDSRQSIYSFNGARPDLFINFKDRYENVRIIPLQYNYRSNSDIVNRANQLMSKHLADIDKPSIPVNVVDEKCVFHKQYYDHVDEANDVVAHIMEKHQQEGIPLKDFFILFRTNAQSQAVEDALIKNGVPYLTSGFSFYERMEIKDILAYMRLALNKHDDVAFRQIFNKPNRYLGRLFLERVRSVNDSHYNAISHEKVRLKNFEYANAFELIDVIDTLNKKAERDTPTEVLDYILKDVGYLNFFLEDLGEDESIDSRMENIETLRYLVSKFDSVKEFIDYVKEMTGKVKKSKNGVQLMTIHKSKGLENKYVFVIGCNNQLLPHHRSDLIDEERRLMYVAVTRAEKKCYLSSTFYYNDRRMSPSPFIEEMGVELDVKGGV